jgi:hypothetical protein
VHYAGMEITNTTKGDEMYYDGENIIHVERDADGNITAWGVEDDGMTDMRTDRLAEVTERIARQLRTGEIVVYT